MKILLGLLGACMEGLCFGCMMFFLEKKGQIVIQKKGRIATDKGVWAAGVSAAAIAAFFSIYRTKQIPLFFYFLTMVIIWGMSVLSVTDAKNKVIPNKFLLLLLVIWVVLVSSYIIFQVQKGVALLALSVAGGLIGGLIFLLCYLLSRGQLGAGDVKLAAVLGLYLTGHRIVGAIFYGVLLCSIYALVLLARKKIGLKDGLPLVPFLYAGMCITLWIV